MKTKLGLGLLLVTSSLWAQELRLGDLNFFQKQGTLYWNSEVSQTKLDTKFVGNTNFASRNRDENHIDRIVWGNRVTYGLTDNLNAGATLNYAVKNKTINDNNTDSLGNPRPTLQTVDDKGLSDITLNATYRLLKEKIYLDLIGAATLGIQDAERGSGSETNSKDGNYKQGHHSVLAGVGIGQKISNLEWRANVLVDYHMSGEQDVFDRTNSLSKVSLDTDSYYNLLLRGQGQYRFLKNFAVSALLEMERVKDRSVSGTFAGVKTDIDYDSYMIWRYGLQGKFNVNDRLLFKAGATLVKDYEIDSKSRAGFTSTNRRFDFSSQRTLMAGAEFLF